MDEDRKIRYAKRTGFLREVRRYANLIRNFRNWHLHLVDKFGLQLPEPLKYRIRGNGLTVEVPRRLSHEFKEIFLEECYTWALPDIGRRGRPTILDVGANVGYFSLFAAHRYPGARIIAFEPAPFNYEHLVRNAERNAEADIKCCKEAVSSETGTVALSLDTLEHFSTGGSVVKDASVQAESIEVEAITLTDFMVRESIDRCALLKMDCEGAEYDIVYECPDETLRKIDNIALEVHHMDEERKNIGSLAENLASRGYHVLVYGNILLASREMK